MRPSIALLDASRIRDVDLSPAPGFAEVLLHTGDVEQAAAVAAGHRRDAERKGQPWSLARAWRTTGLLAGDDEIDAAFGTALTLHAATPDVYGTARTNLAYGSGGGGPGGGSTRGAG